MAKYVQILRSLIAGTVPPIDGDELPGQLFVNFPDNQLGIGDALGFPVNLLAIRFHSNLGKYAIDDIVVSEGKLLVCILGHEALSIDPIHWADLSTGESASVVKFDGGASATAYLDTQILDGGQA